MQIGILIEKNKALCDWKLYFINRLINEDISIKLIYDKQRATKDRHIGNLTSESKLLRNCALVQKTIEKKILNKNFTTKEREKLINNLKGISNFSLDEEKIKLKEFDLIIKLAPVHITKNLQKLTKFGIWSLSYNNIPFQKRNIVGLKEVVLKQSAIKITLHNVTKNNTKRYIIDEAFFNIKTSIYITHEKVLLESITLLLKNIKIVKTNNKPNFFEIDNHKEEPVTALKISHFFKYCLRFYQNLFSRIVKKVNPFKEKENDKTYWGLFYGEGNILENDLTSLTPICPPKNEFWADPFLFTYKTKKYAFFENFPFEENIGKISCGEIKDGKVCNVQDILKKDYHLSFPFIFEEDGEIFLMPETGGNNRLEIYKSVVFPTEWIPYAYAFDGEKIADAFFHTDKEGKKWLFVNKQITELSIFSNELYVYQVDSLRLKSLIPHKLNPVIIDTRVARNGGPIFEHKNRLYRPSQNNTYGIYGRALNINEIVKLSLEEYVEKKIKTIEPEFLKNLVSTHHLHQIKNGFIIDAAFSTNLENKHF